MRNTMKVFGHIREGKILIFVTGLSISWKMRIHDFLKDFLGKVVDFFSLGEKGWESYWFLWFKERLKCVWNLSSKNYAEYFVRVRDAEKFFTS